MTDIKNLIPQRSPIMMVDELLEAHDDVARCSLTIREDNFFLEPDDAIAEPGVICRPVQQNRLWAISVR